MKKLTAVKTAFSVCAVIAAAYGCMMFEPKTFDGVDIAPGDINADDLTRLECVRSVSGDPIVIVKDNVAKLPIVFADNRANRDAANFLAETVFEMTGVKPKVIVERKGKAVTNAPAFYIGDTAAAAAAGLTPFRKKTGRWDGVESERFRVVAKDGSFYFVGRGDYAVYDWCERQLDVRFYWGRKPSEMRIKGTNFIYGKCTVATKGLAARPVDYEDQPVFAQRDNWPYENSPWNICAKGGDSHRGGVNVHAPHGWWKDTNLVARLPEIFARSPDGQRATSPLLCYGSPETVEYYKQRIDEHIKGVRDSGGIVNTNKKVVTISQWDCGVYCSCEHCKKLLDPKLGGAGSGSPIIWTYFTTKISKWLKEKYPDYIISTLPYANTCLVPPGYDVSEYANVESMLCTMPGLAMLKNESCKKREEDLIRQWVKATGRPVLNWHYSCWPAEFTSAPFVYGETIRRHYEDMRGLISGTFINGGYDVVRLQLSMYVWMRCLWNPDIDVQAVYDGFCRRMFGKAASTMRKIVDMQETGWNRQWGSNMCSVKNIYEISYPREEVLEMQRLFAKAKKEAEGDEKAAVRIAWYEKGFEKFFKESEENASGTAFVPFMMKKAGVQPVIDGKLDDTAWAAAEGRTFVRARDKNNPTPVFATEVKAVWTDKGITFGVKADEPAIARMHMGAPKGDPWAQDTFEIFIDPSGSADGHWYQLLIDNNARLSPSSSGIGWKAKDVKIAIASGEKGWSMEVYVPYDALKNFPGVQLPTTSANGVVWLGNMIRWRVGDMKLPKEQRVEGSCNEMSRLNTRFNIWNRDPAAFSKFVFVE